MQALKSNSAAGQPSLTAAAPDPATQNATTSPVTAAADANAQDWAGVTDGVDFLTQLQCSVRLGGRTFRSVAAELRLDPMARSELAPAVDAHMQHWFEQNRTKGEGPIAAEQAHEELRSTLASTLKSH